MTESLHRADLLPLFAPPKRSGGGEFPGSVCAAVLTYNRKDVLVLCLDALRTQIDRPEAILVLDNGSTDGTRDMLRQRGLLAEPSVVYVRLEQNIGASGGFAALFRHVHDSGYDWGWFMDDDVIAAPDALLELKRTFAEHFRHPDEIAYLTSAAVTADGQANDVPDIDGRRSGGCAFPLWSDLLAFGLVRIRNSALNAILIPRGVLQRHGAPSPDFRVWGEDTDYTLRITRDRPAFLVGRSRVVHLRGVPGALSVFTEHDRKRLDRFYYLYRNTVYLRRAHWPRHAVWLFVLKALGHAARCVTMRRRQPVRRAWLVLSGMIAGFFFTPRYCPFGGSGAAEPNVDQPASALRAAACASSSEVG